MNANRHFISSMIRLALIATGVFLIIQFVLPRLTGKTEDIKNSPPPSSMPVESQTSSEDSKPEPLPEPVKPQTWWYFIDLKTDGSVWMDEEHYSETEFIAAFDAHRAQFKSVKVSLNVSYDTDRRFQNRLETHLKQQGIAYDFYKDPFEARMDEFKERYKNRDFTNEEVHIYLKANGNLILDFVEYTMDEFLEDFNMDYKLGNFELVIIEEKYVRSDTVRRVKKTLETNGFKIQNR